jgi:DDE superfamily endonuclease
MASRWAPGDYHQLHHFIASGVWNEALLEEELAIQADKLIGGARAVLVVDDTALPKEGSHSVAVRRIAGLNHKVEDQPSTALSQEADVGVKWNVHRG